MTNVSVAVPLLTPAELAAMFRVDPKDGDPLGQGRQAHLDPNPRRAPPLPRDRGPRPSRLSPTEPAKLTLGGLVR